MASPTRLIVLISVKLTLPSHFIGQNKLQSHDESEVYPVPDKLLGNRAHISGIGQYQVLYEESISQMPVFWDRVRIFLTWLLITILKAHTGGE